MTSLQFDLPPPRTAGNRDSDAFGSPSLSRTGRQSSLKMRESVRSSAVTPAGGMRLNAGGTQALQTTANISDTDNIKVAVRVRPLFATEREKQQANVLQVTDDHSMVKVVVPGPAGNKMQRDFQFHACLGPETSQSDVLHLCGVPQLLDAAMSGYNVTIFAYGQTGSGKTYTMSGREEAILREGYSGDTNDGIVTRAVHYLYQQIKERNDAKYALSASYLEIYNEGVYDLLAVRTGTSGGMGTGGGAPVPPRTASGMGSTAAFGSGVGAPVGGAKDLNIKWDAGQGFYVPGLKTVQCSTVDRMMEVIRTGMKHRHVGSHELNMESSRSHSLMTIHCAAQPTDPNAWDFGTMRFGKICFVDLAGSERLKDSKSEGTMLKETTNINKSLFVLGKVISALAERDAAGLTSAHIPYRDSKLTKLLMDSLGGSAMALMIACCSPSSAHVEETLSTLSYATRAKNIQNRPVVQYDPKEAQITSLRREIELLRQENAYLRDQLRMGGASMPGTPMTIAALMGPGEADLGSPTGGTPMAGASHPEWPSLVAGGGGGGGQTHHGVQDRASGGTRNAAPMRQSSPRDGGGAGGGGAGGGSGGAPRLEPLRMPPGMSGGDSWGEESVVGAPLSARPGSGAIWRGNGGMAAAGAVEPDLMKRLKDTQSLLARFSEENSRLARECDRLRVGRQAMNNEHAEVLDEIELLRSKLSGLETAVLAGGTSASVAKEMLQVLRSQAPSRERSGALPGGLGLPPGSSPSHSNNQMQMPHAPSPLSGTPTPGNHHPQHRQPGHTPSSPSLLGSKLSLSELAKSRDFGEPAATQPGGAPELQDQSISTASSSTGGATTSGGGAPQPQPPAGGARKPYSRSGSQLPHGDGSDVSQSQLAPPTSAQAPVYPGQQQGAGAMTGGGAALAAALQVTPGPGAQGGTGAPHGIANIMSLGSSTGAQMRTRQAAYGGGGGGGGGGKAEGGGTGGIIVADQSKIAMLLGLGGGGGPGGAPPAVPQQPPSPFSAPQSQPQYSPASQQYSQGYGYAPLVSHPPQHGWDTSSGWDSGEGSQGGMHRPMPHRPPPEPAAYANPLKAQHAQYLALKLSQQGGGSVSGSLDSQGGSVPGSPGPR